MQIEHHELKNEMGIFLITLRGSHLDAKWSLSDWPGVIITSLKVVQRFFFWPTLICKIQMKIKHSYVHLHALFLMCIFLPDVNLYVYWWCTWWIWRYSHHRFVFTAFLCAPSGFFHHFVCNIKIVGYKKSCKLETMFYSFKVNKENLIISNIFIYVYKYIYYFLLLPYVTARIVENSTWKWC